MKKQLFSSLLLVLGTSVLAQTKMQVIPNNVKATKQYTQTRDNSVSVNLNVAPNPTAPVANFTAYQNGMTEEIIGETYYDLQSNAAIQNRLFVHDDGTISATWTMSPNTIGGFPERGTGYNYYDGSAWMPLPDSRVESIRTGWSSIAGLNGGEIIASHTFSEDEAGTVAITSRLTKGEGEWDESLMPNLGEDQYENVWPRMKVGGPDGQTVHLISNTYEPNFVSYSRSLDGGETWDIEDVILPEIGPDYYTSFGGDSYALDVRGETVAFVVGNAYTDVVLMKSTDNGDTWTKTIVKEHPIPFYNDSIIVDSLTYPELDGVVETSDQAFSISLDANGNAHVFYGLWNYSNDEAGDDMYTYYPFTDGIEYWNEETQMDSVITYVVDINGNDTLDIDSMALLSDYSSSLSSFPSSAIAEDGSIYLVYSSVVETFYDIQNDLGADYAQHYRHVYIMRSQDGGSTWSEPYDIMEELTDPMMGDPLNEGVFGCIANIVDDHIYLTYQRDYLPGLHVRGDEDPATNNSIVFVSIPVEGFDQLSIKEDALSNDFNIYPNPTSGLVTVSNLDKFENPNIKVVNLLGSIVYSNTVSTNEHNINLDDLSNGVYLISIEDDNNRVVKRLIKN